MAHVATYKKDVVKELRTLMKQYPIVGTIDLEGLPTPQLQNMRASLRPDVIIKVSKRRIIKFAIEDAKKDVKGIEELEKHLRGMPALIFAKENPFKLYKKLNASKSPAPAKAGQIATKDIIIPAGKTSFAPGPVIAELSGIGVKAGVQEGKVAVKEDALVAKEGTVIKQKVAEMLTRLGILPMEVGLNLVAVYENGTVYPSKLLAIDEKKFMQDLADAANWAINLSVEAGYPTKDTIEIMIAQIFRQTKGLAIEVNIIIPETVGDILAKANAQGTTLKNELNI